MMLAAQTQCLEHRTPLASACPARRALRASALHMPSSSLASPTAQPRLGRRRGCTASRRSGGAAARCSASKEISYIMIKPDGVQRGLVGEIISRLERKGFRLAAVKLFTPSTELAEEHYKDLSSKPFFKDLVAYITSGPVVAMVWEGEGVVLSARKLIGATNPLQAEPGTIRGDLAVQTGRNVVHGSDSPENGVRETGLWFGESGTVDWSPALGPWLRE